MGRGRREKGLSALLCPALCLQHPGELNTDSDQEMLCPNGRAGCPTYGRKPAPGLGASDQPRVLAK